ncbi:AAA ATPase central domain protein [Thermodesulfobium narugense DSM 14796]|uniref:Replication-associated recombination protein A n=1 Tax=Thermodesulfobium narugense DSM 14796 TaxID=747365 RepID=M1E6D9_9BACT|nr:replication-associated recombination protein A [Thermodesulfobium narugense]AEE14751.1 AAA ATPase central domain protein [Thermodesulfobium narugense DSM 14796]
MKNLFESEISLSQAIRPKNLDEFLGQSHLLRKDGTIYKSIVNAKLRSVILYGPPGVGKTTLAKIIASYSKANFEILNAVLSGVPELRKIIEKAIDDKKRGIETLLFVDEVHRWNKAQQDALLPVLEDNTIRFVGATVENPFFYIIKPLLSRSLLLTLHPLNKEDLSKLFDRAINYYKRYKNKEIIFDMQTKELIINLAQKDARYLLNIIELIVESSEEDTIRLSKDALDGIIEKKLLFDKSSDQHYDTISAFIKSIRGSDPDAAIYYLALMLNSGEDPRFIARRLIILASEDIGMADPYAITIAVSTLDAVNFVGLPEAEINLAHATVYLACAPKSNTAYIALNNAKKSIQDEEILKIPEHLKNIHTEDLKNRYLYPHDFPDHFVRQRYLSENKKFYYPSDVGFEKKIKERIQKLWGDEK